MKIDGDYAVIETAEEAACLGLAETMAYGYDGKDRVPRCKVLETITPKEGEAIFILYGTIDDCDPPHYHNSPTAGWMHLIVVKANALTIGKTCGELRELLAWCNS